MYEERNRVFRTGTNGESLPFVVLPGALSPGRRKKLRAYEKQQPLSARKRFQLSRLARRSLLGTHYARRTPTRRQDGPTGGT
ncbi:hypothetical protein PC129_g14153 [Phytophthora cactorum]|uniref:Uncharacterized protein n=1 Tax=Phytophthora cactorum TaxID=29920 RepID=A0A8T1CEC0_9STRA|nr:hypothetical protein PC114_g18613 [Phytophthora cactorum]KAG2919555.1 hypothetical protein PC117_g16734 [Phytophthora cactorum]KAG2996048.1 hypothetical protein PC119_g17940 [Phytophthora cactorum]KAG3006447.1 hypothetical protein PC120_g17355 [Phytophthora cactorum]KAG3160429.1 hypothetical protein C6341_g13799 [Phytophthora cactorum]